MTYKVIGGLICYFCRSQFEISTSEWGHGALHNEPTTSEVKVFAIIMHTKENSEDWYNGDPISHPSHSPDSLTKGTGSKENDKITPLAKPLAIDTLGRWTSQSTEMSDQVPKIL